ncbi:MAG TPA: GerAB/ArcD/ProY family transporter [Bacillota bacterium]|nr:GerAB/ArcD/ProY family transporter [Bacillota bacterium]
MARIPESGIINTKQNTWLLFIIITSFTALQVPGLLIFQAGRDAWLSVFFAWFFDVLLAVVYAYMGIRFPGENPVQYSTTILGKFLGKLAGLAFILFYLIVSVDLMRGLGMYIGSVFLPKTPIEIILVGAFLVIAYIVHKGIEVIGRICEILGPLYLASFIVLFLLALPSAHFRLLKPQFDQGIYPFLSGIPLILSYIGICISMGWYSAISDRPENGFLAKFSAVSLGTLVINMVIVNGISCFGASDAGNMVNPGLQLVRLIRVGDYFERMEVLWMVIAIGAGIMVAVNSLWIVSLGIAQITGLSGYKKLINPIALLAFFLTVSSFPNNTVFLNFTFYIFPIVGILVETGLEMFLFCAALISGKKG